MDLLCVFTLCPVLCPGGLCIKGSCQFFPHRRRKECGHGQVWRTWTSLALTLFLSCLWQVHNVAFAFELMLDGGLKKPKARPEGNTPPESTKRGTVGARTQGSLHVLWTGGRHFSAAHGAMQLTAPAICPLQPTLSVCFLLQMW